MKVYIIVQETEKESYNGNGTYHTYYDRENVAVHLSEKDANFDLKYTFKSTGDISYFMEVFDA